MNTSASLSSTSSTVDAICFQTSVTTVGTSIPNPLEIHISSKQLTLLNIGVAYRSSEPSPSNEAFEILTTYSNVSKQTLNQLAKKADEKAYKKIQVPVESTDEIIKLLDEKEKLDQHRKAIDKAIAEATKKIFDN